MVKNDIVVTRADGREDADAGIVRCSSAVDLARTQANARSIASASANPTATAASRTNYYSLRKSNMCFALCITIDMMWCGSVNMTSNHACTVGGVIANATSLCNNNCTLVVMFATHAANTRTDQEYGRPHRLSANEDSYSSVEQSVECVSGGPE